MCELTVDGMVLVVQVERFRREKLADFKRIILDYIQMQIEYSKKVCCPAVCCWLVG